MDNSNTFLFLVVVVYVLFHFRRHLFPPLERSFKRRFIPFPQEYRKIIQTYFQYYKILPSEEKKLFEERMRDFMYSKEFIGRNGLQVTLEMKVLISASAVQLTFGLPMIFLANFHRILIYPDSYYSNINKQYHYGEVNPRAGIIVLSWMRFIEGYTDHRDSLNVGLHEMAHAIHFENQIANNEFGFLDGNSLKNLRKIFQREKKNMENGDQNYLRAYAATDEYEFFAVSIEHFFEDPGGLKKNLPDLYDTLQYLLNQDPLRLVE